MRIAAIVEVGGGNVTFEFVGPDWIPGTVSSRLMWLNRVRHISLQTGKTFNCCGDAKVGTYEKPIARQSGRAELVASFGHLSHLEYLNVDDTDVTDDVVRQLSVLAKLKSLHLSNTSISDDAMAYLGRLKQLEYLSLQNTQLGDSALRNLSGLQRIRVLLLSGTRITDAGLDHLGALQSLTRIELTSTLTTAEGREKLRSRLANCEVVCVDQ